MMSLFNFKRMLKKYGVTLTVIVAGEEGYWDTNTGLYVQSTTPSDVVFSGVWLALNDDELRYDEGGTFTFEDRKIIVDNSITLTKGQLVKNGEDRFKIDRSKPYDTYSHFTVHYCKRVTA